MKPSSPCRPPRSLQPERLAHDLVVGFLAALRTQVESHLVDDLDAQVAQPVVPAVGADVLVNLLAQLVAHWRPRETARVIAGGTARPLAAEAVARRARGGLRRPLRRRRLLAQLGQQFRYLVARDVVAAL